MIEAYFFFFFFFSSRRRHTRSKRDWSSDVCSSDLIAPGLIDTPIYGQGEGAEAFKDKLKRDVLFPHRLGTSEEFATLAVELVTNSYMNAESIRIDGGIRMQPK